ncbi:MAG: sigma-70 family RNA polymerase sigma factor [Nanoarchaeota archaeon]|nr:sigma-70 family RNA polymerase sigma factor [Nanoarchaeota archaeon]
MAKKYNLKTYALLKTMSHFPVSRLSEIEDSLKAYQGLDHSKKLTLSQVAALYTNTSLESDRKEINDSYSYTLREVVSALMLFYEVRNDKCFPVKMLENYGWEKNELENIIDDYTSVYQASFLQKKCKKLLTKEEEKEIGKRIAKGDIEARAEMINMNLRLVMHIANKYRNSGLDFDDIFSEGRIGLIKAVDKCDYGRETKFSTYADFWIKQSIQEAIRKNLRHIRVPQDVYGDLFKLNKAERYFLGKHGRSPDPNELADMMDMPSDKIDFLLESSRIGVVSLYYQRDSDISPLINICCRIKKQ